MRPFIHSLTNRSIGLIPPSQPNPTFSRRITASEAVVRDVLADLRNWLSSAQVDEDTCGTVEIVMAEALNNIVEHAYSEAGPGPVEIDVAQKNGNLSFTLCDVGLALPGLRLPAGQLPASDGPVADLPEGGFGWFLIHRLACDLTYVRQGGQNILCFQISSNQAFGT